jgi:hypothetical protein
MRVADQLTTMQCGTCGVWHAIPTVMYKTAVEEGGYWHCPNGHQRGFREGRRERDAVLRERDRLKQMIAQDDEIAASRARCDKAAKEIDRLKKRAKAGTCPCCKRTFSNMARHMKTKHPEMLSDKVVKMKSA